MRLSLRVLNGFKPNVILTTFTLAVIFRHKTHGQKLRSAYLRQLIWICIVIDLTAILLFLQVYPADHHPLRDENKQKGWA